MAISQDEINVYKKRAKNIVVAYILAESVYQLRDLIISYF